jgi:prolyl-tRNA synthetase
MVKAIALVHEKQHEKQFVLLLLRGDHMLNEIKAQKIEGLDPFRFASDAEIEQHLGCKPGFIGPVGVGTDVRVIADRSVATLHNFSCGANAEGFHLRGVNWGRDLPVPSLVADLRNVVDGDPSPDGKGSLQIQRGIEVGHIFQLRTKYAEALKAGYLDDKGKAHPFEMGCYGIGITRIVGAAIEQGHDERGIIFPTAIAPFTLALVPMGYGRSESVRNAADQLYAELSAAGIDVLLDDRDERPGVLLADMELIGVPHRIVIGDRSLKEGKVEYQARGASEAQQIALGDVLNQMMTRIQSQLQTA